MCVRRGAVNHNGVSSSLLKHTQPSLTPLAHLLHLCFLSKLRPARSCEAKSTSLNLNLIHRHSRKTKQSNATMEIRTLSFPADSPPPLPVIVAAKLAGLALPINTSLPPNSAPTLLLSNGYSFFFFFDKDLFFLPKA